MQRITYFERQVIEVGLRCQKSIRAIARSIGRDHTVVKREIDRNNGLSCPYTATVAQRLFEKRKSDKNTKKLEKVENTDLKEYVVMMLKEDWSPDEIAGVLKKHPPTELVGKTISHESIYQYIYDGEGRYEGLYPHLRKGRSKRRRQKGRKTQDERIPSKVSIHQRPDEINKKTVYGHWESDTVEGPRCAKTNLSVQYERKGMLVRINKVSDKTAAETENAIRKGIDDLPEYLWKSITFDNGGESATHTKLRDDYDIQTYHCDAYASWQKGGVENINGLIRQYVPKGTDISNFTDEQIYGIQERLNNRPRKSLNYLSPNQVIAQIIGGGGAMKP